MEAYKGKKIEDKPVIPEEYVLKSDYDKLQNQVKDLSEVVNNINKNNTDKSQQRRDNK
jgi:tetrahydromethanopterin S-methyltransferase subunit G